MRILTPRAQYRSAICLVLLLSPITIHAWDPNNKDIDHAVSSGDFGAYYTNITGWLNQKTPTSVTEDTLKELLNDGGFVTALDQYQFISKCGAATLGAFAKADKANQVFLSWLLKDSAVMDLYLEAGDVPSGEGCVATLALWSKIFNTDPESREGIYLKIAIATALVRPVPFQDERGTPRVTDPYEGRYLYFKKAHQDGDLLPSFERLSVWEVKKVVDALGAPPVDLTWVREMIHTWRPDLKRENRLVNIVSEVKYGGSPVIPIVDMASVLDAGGMCERRAHFGMKTCAAFGIPSVKILQRNHAALAWKTGDNTWKVEYGAGWARSWLERQDGGDFVAEAVARSHAAEFSQSEHLKWFASALTATDTGKAITELAVMMVPRSTDPQAMAIDPETKAEMESNAASPKTSATVESTLITLTMDTTRIDADNFHSMTNVMVYDSWPDGTGKQVNFQKNTGESWIDYAVDAPKAGTYSLALKLAAPNRDQVLYVTTGAGSVVTNNIPNTRGHWGMTDPLRIELGEGEQRLRIAAPLQRGIAVKWLELKHIRDG